MTAFSNKKSFCRIHKLAPICIKTNLRENRFFLRHGVSGWWIKRALIMLKSLPKIRQNDSVAYTRIGNGTENTFALQPPTQTVAGYAAHGQRRQHHANVKVICHWQPVSWLVEITLNNFRQVTFWDITTFFQRQMRQNFIFHCIFVQYFVHERGVYLGFYSTKIIDSSQFVEI